MTNKRTINNIAKILAVAMGAFAVAAPLTACNPEGDRNEIFPLVLATDVLDTVFNPFFYSSGSDGEVIAQTQISMLSSDASGNLIANWSEPSVAFDFGVATTGKSTDKISGANGDAAYENYYTEYYFALKDNIKFSDGTPLTYKDVLFNIYMYLDPAYTGSSTMYSVDIKGLSAYRSGIADNTGMDFDKFYDTIVEARLDMFYEWAADAVYYQNRPGFNFSWDNTDNYEYYLKDGDTRKVFIADLEMLQDLFRDEINSDWTAAMSVDVAKDYEKYVDKDNKALFTENWQVFLYNYNVLQLTRVPGLNGGKDYYELVDNYNQDDHSEQKLKDYVFGMYFGDYKTTSYASFATQLLQVIDYTATSATFRNYLKSDVMSYYRESQSDEDKVDRVSGVEVLRLDSIKDTKKDSEGRTVKDVNGNDVIETRQLTDADGNAKTYDVLHITINGVDPKAIQNFGFTVAPGHYYSSIWSQTNMNYGNDYAQANFGVQYNNFTFMRGIRENQLPLGAGPYKAANSRGENAANKNEFCNNNTVYLRANPNFMLGEPIIKNLYFQVVNSNMLYDAVKTGQVHFASPSMTREQVGMLNGTDRNILNSASAENLGYGYIGVSARYVPNLWVRRAIMSTFDPELCVAYYGGSEYASIIRRPMSKTLTNYYSEEDFADFGNYSYYPYGQEGGKEEDLKNVQDPTAAAEEIARKYVQMGGCADNNGDGILEDPVTGMPLRYTFTVAGNSDDHPAYSLLVNSREILNKIGFDITVTQDSTALSKLAAGRLAVWAAAWSSSSDPDMYQVYHKDSTATSTLAWGYSYLMGSQHQNNTNAAERRNELAMLEDLADLIDSGRETTDVDERKDIYISAQNKLMQLAIEFPTYQRKVYYVWGSDVFDESTMHTGADVTTYQSPLSRIWEVSLKQD